MIKNALKSIGLTEGEIKVYLALLELGVSSIGAIIKKSFVSGSKTYEVLDRLAEKGLVGSITKNGVKYFEASSPERILDYLEEKKKNIEIEKSNIQKVIPELILKQKSYQFSEVKVFTGFEGAKTVYEDAIKSLKKGEIILGWGLTDQPESWESYFNEREKTRSKKGIIHKTIINEKYKSVINLRKKLPNTKIRFFPKELEMPTSIELWKNKVAIFIVTNQNPLTILIESEAAAESFRKYFYVMWEKAKKS